MDTLLNFEFDRAATFAFLAVVVSFIRYGTYFHSIYKKETRPHVFSWLNWGIISGIGAYAQLKLDGGLSAWILLFVASMSLVIAFMSLFIGEKNITKGDWYTFLGALVVIPVWAITDSPFWAIVMVVIIDLLTYYPTIRKSWNDPWGEPPISSFWAGFRYFLILFTLPVFKVETMLYPFFLMAVDWGFAVYVLWRRKVLRTNPIAVEKL